MLFLISLVVVMVQYAHGFYLPGLQPTYYCEEEGNPNCKTKVDVYVNRLTSTETMLPYEHDAFNFCETKEPNPTMNLGQVLFGERINLSPYQFSFMKNETCIKVCEKKYEASDDKLNFLKYGMLFSYMNHWIIDNMPVAWCYITTSERKYCSTGFPMGCYVDKHRLRKDACQMNPTMFNSRDAYYLFNHVDIMIQYHSGKGKDWIGSRLVRVTVEPRSYQSETCEGGPMEILERTTKSINVPYTYSVYFVENNSIEWASRWDFILDRYGGDNIQIFSITNSSIVVLFLSVMLALVLLRASGVCGEIQLCCRVCRDPDMLIHGWKAVHGDVFRPPRRGRLLLAVLDGTGAQILWALLVTLAFACAGFLSPANPGALEMTFIISFILLSFLSGYKSTRFCKSFNIDGWKTTALLTCFLVPGLIFSIFLLINCIYWATRSSAAVPIMTILLLVGLQLGVSLPLTFAGAYLAQRKKVPDPPVPVNPSPRSVPHQRCYKHPIVSVIVGGILPFGCMFIQLFFFLNSIWSSQVNYMFGFQTITAALVIITCAECSILLCYFHLSSEDYRWWWRSFFTSGSAGFYFFIYCIDFYFRKLEIEGVVNVFVYIGHTLIMTILLIVACGHIGLASCYWFITKLYGYWMKDQAQAEQVTEQMKENMEKKMVRTFAKGESAYLVQTKG